MKPEADPFLPLVVRTLKEQDRKEINLKLLCKEVYKEVEPRLCRAHSDMNVVLKQIWNALGECQRQKIVDFKSDYSEDDEEDDDVPSSSSGRPKIRAKDSMTTHRKNQNKLKRLKSATKSKSISESSTITLEKNTKTSKH